MKILGFFKMRIDTLFPTNAQLKNYCETFFNCTPKKLKRKYTDLRRKFNCGPENGPKSFRVRNWFLGILDCFVNKKYTVFEISEPTIGQLPIRWSIFHLQKVCLFWALRDYAFFLQNCDEHFARFSFSVKSNIFEFVNSKEWPSSKQFIELKIVSLISLLHQYCQ